MTSSTNDKLAGLFASSGPPASSSIPSNANPKPNLVAFQVTNSIKNNLKRIFKTVLEFKILYQGILTSPERDLSKSKHLRCKEISPIWSATTSFNNAKITLPYSKLGVSTESILPPRFPMIKPYYVGSNTRERLKLP